MIRRLSARLFGAEEEPGDPPPETPREILAHADRQELGGDETPDLTARYR